MIRASGCEGRRGYRIGARVAPQPVVGVSFATTPTKKRRCPQGAPPQLFNDASFWRISRRSGLAAPTHGDQAQADEARGGRAGGGHGGGEGQVVDGRRAAEAQLNGVERGRAEIGGGEGELVGRAVAERDARVECVVAGRRSGRRMCTVLSTSPSLMTS